MSAELPELSRDDFRRRLESVSPVRVVPATLAALYAHYQELRRWSPALSLIGPAAAGDVVERHYGESLAGVPLLPAGARVLVDIGSGAGFPGFVLAAACPELEVTLVEPRERRWSFLRAACRRAALSCRCLDVRVERPLAPGLPESIDVITARALKLPAEVLGDLAERLTPGGRVLVWAGEADPETPAGLVRSGERPIPGSRHRRIVELTASAENQG